MTQILRRPLFVALDVDAGDLALELARRLSPLGCGFKIGPRLLMRFGSELIQKLATLGPVFVDCKFLDIPSTMDAAIRASFDAGASFASIHAWAGPAALAKMAEVERDLNKSRPFRILAVTILTSFSKEGLPPPANQFGIAQQVQQLAESVAQNGLSGLVASGHEVAVLKARFPHLFYVVPGIRSASDAVDDQRRTMSASQAFEAGASALVVGRPILQAADPVRATESILESCATVPKDWS